MMNAPELATPRRSMVPGYHQILLLVEKSDVARIEARLAPRTVFYVNNYR